MSNDSVIIIHDNDGEDYSTRRISDISKRTTPPVARSSSGDNNTVDDDINITVSRHVRKRSMSGNVPDLDNILEMSHPNVGNMSNSNANINNSGGNFQLPREDMLINSRTSHAVDSDESTPSSSWSMRRGMSKSLITLLARFSLSLTMIIFCIVRLSSGLTADERTLYISMLSGTVGAWMPSPLQDKKK